MKKVLVTGSSVEERFFEPLKELGYIVANPKELLSEDELSRELSDAEGYLLGGDEFASAKALSKATKLKVISFLGVGYESFIDVKGVQELGIAVTNTPGVLANAVAEFTVGQLLNARRRLTQYCNAYARSESGKEQKQHDIAGHKVGIVGLGAIGTRIAEILVNGFKADVSYYSRTRKPDQEERLNIHYAELADLMREVEILIVMVPATPETRGLISSALLRTLPSGALLINTAKPEVVDPKGLADCLESGQIQIAAFDGFYEAAADGQLVERLKSWGTDRLLVTGHIASLTHDARDAMAARAVSSMCNVLSGTADPYVVFPGRR
jgi:lactate dehydrogenase-like 2-hydroxyacid dehydrogenase